MKVHSELHVFGVSQTQNHLYTLVTTKDDERMKEPQYDREQIRNPNMLLFKLLFRFTVWTSHKRLDARVFGFRVTVDNWIGLLDTLGYYFLLFFFSFIDGNIRNNNRDNGFRWKCWGQLVARLRIWATIVSSICVKVTNEWRCTSSYVRT